MRLSRTELNRLLRDTSALVGRAVRARDVVATLEEIARTSKDARAVSFAEGCLAELLCGASPWKASLHARRLLARHPDDARAWAALGIAQAALGNARYAVHAFQEAHARAPENPFYQHNLGHLLDVALNRPEEAIPHLEAAVAARPWREAWRASLARANRRCGDVAGALVSGPVLVPAEGLFGGGPAPRRPGLTRRATARKRLSLGLQSLPFTDAQKESALRLLEEAYDALTREERTLGADALAASVALALARIAALPLGDRDVASTFRVSTASAREGAAWLTGALRLRPFDARYLSLAALPSEKP